MPGLVVRAERSGRRALTALVLWAVCLLGACGTTSAPALDSLPPTPAPPAKRIATSSIQTLVDGLAAAVRAHDQQAFQRQLSGADPAFPAVAARIYRTLTALPLTSLRFAVRPLESELNPDRRALLGPLASARQVAVRWQLSGDAGVAEHLVWLTVVPHGAAVAWAGVSDGSRPRSAQPVWWGQQVVAVRSGATTVLARDRAVAARWLPAGNAAVNAVRTRLHAGVGRGWNHRLVLEVPATRRAFDAVLGVAPGSYGPIAAVAWPEGPEVADAAVRIVVNPDLTRQLDPESLRVLLTHEATHVATRSAASEAPTWLVEGFADYLAYDAYPQTADRAAAEVVAQVRVSGTPRSLPSNADFTPAAEHLQQSYGEAWLACRYLARSFSPVALNRFYRLVDSGAGVSEALQMVFGLTESTLTARWAASVITGQPPPGRRAPGG